jgi:galactose mutarotase-like enzyme
MDDGHGDGLLRLENERLTVTLRPAHGCQVVSLLDRQSGREWLTAAPHGPRDSRYGDPFDGRASYGWDECFPTVGAGRYPLAPFDGLTLPDHGEVWTAAWRVDEVTPRSIATSVDGHALPYRFARSLELDGPRLGVRYEVVNTAADALACLWSMHPGFEPTPGTAIHLPDGAPFRVEGSTQPLAVAPGTRSTWPRLGNLDLRRVPVREDPIALKLFTDRGSVDRAALSLAGGWLGISFDAAVTPFLGIWLDERDWPAEGPVRQLCLEPASGDADTLDDALANGSAWRLEPGEARRWCVDITVGSGEASLSEFLGGRP